MQPTDIPYREHAPSQPLAPLHTISRWIYGVVAVLMIAAMLGGIGLMAAAFVHKNEHGVEDQDLLLAGVFGIAGAILLLYAQAFTAVAWLYRVWSWLPPHQRYTKMWRSWITPGQAGFFLLLPYFHFYWMFVVNLGLCDALDRMRTERRAATATRTPAPRGLAMAAMIAQLVQLFVPIPVSGILWLLYMTRVERVAREMSTG